jgi:hypothetical protein
MYDRIGRREHENSSILVADFPPRWVKAFKADNRTGREADKANRAFGVGIFPILPGKKRHIVLKATAP